MYSIDIMVIFSYIITLFVGYFQRSEQDEPFKICRILRSIIISNFKYFISLSGGTERIMNWFSTPYCNESATDFVTIVNNSVIWKHFEDCSMKRNVERL